MKKLSFFFLFLPLLSFSQKFSVSFLRPSPTAYIGIDNPITCTVEGIDCKNIIIITNNGTITKLSCNSYLYRPERQADTKLDIYKLARNKKKKVGEYYLRVRNFPDPIAYVGGYPNNHIIKKAILKAQGGVAAICPPGFGFDLKYTVLRFNVSVFRDDKTVSNTHCNGNAFTKEVYEQFSVLKEGDMVLFHFIYVQTEENGDAKLVTPVQLVITE
jgi:hypothetical protein